MAKMWREVRRNLNMEREARVKQRVEEAVSKLPLTELRKARLLTQVRLAELLHKMEKRSDMYISTLRSCVEVMGGRLDICAAFPEGEVALEHLDEPKEREAACV